MAGNRFEEGKTPGSSTGNTITDEAIADLIDRDQIEPGGVVEAATKLGGEIKPDPTQK